MASHGTVEYATAEGNDMPAHEATYENFIKLAFVGTLHVICVAVGLAVGGVEGHWFWAAAIFVFATIAAGISLIMDTKGPIVTLLVLSLVALALGA